MGAHYSQESNRAPKHCLLNSAQFLPQIVPFLFLRELAALSGSHRALKLNLDQFLYNPSKKRYINKSGYRVVINPDLRELGQFTSAEKIYISAPNLNSPISQSLIKYKLTIDVEVDKLVLEDIIVSDKSRIRARDLTLKGCTICSDSIDSGRLEKLTTIKKEMQEPEEPEEPDVLTSFWESTLIGQNLLR